MQPVQLLFCVIANSSKYSRIISLDIKRDERINHLSYLYCMNAEISIWEYIQNTKGGGCFIASISKLSHDSEVVDLFVVKLASDSNLLLPAEDKKF